MGNDHLIDVLRAARTMLDRISALHNTPTLIPTDELKKHIQNLQGCLVLCKRQRITHHANAIHPLQTTFEDLIEQFTYELRVFSGRSITAGHKSARMIMVSRFLRMRMDKRDRALALFSPLIRRVLMKLLALRMFIDLVENAGADNKVLVDDDALKADSSDEEEVGMRHAVDVFANPDAGAVAAFERGDGGLDEDEDADDADLHQAQLAEMLASKKAQPQDGGGADESSSEEGDGLQREGAFNEEL